MKALLGEMPERGMIRRCKRAVEVIVIWALFKK